MLEKRLRWSEMSSFYQGKRVLITGHTGFKGTWLALLMEKFGARVCGYALPVNKFSFYAQIKPEIEMEVEGDISDESRVLNTFEAFKPEIVFHLAAHSTLDGNMEIPHYILKTNVMGTLNVLEAIRKVKSVQAAVIITSDKCYMNRETNVAYNENDLLGARDPYGTSKVCQEFLKECYSDTFFNNTDRPIGISSARASNLIGIGDYNISRLMPYLLESFSNGQIPNIRNPHAIRSWHYVIDVLWGYMLLAKKNYEYAESKEYNGAYNFGPDDDGIVDVGTVARMVGQCFGVDSFNIVKTDSHVGKEANILKLDSTKAKEMLDWCSIYSLKDAIETITSFIKKQRNGEDAGILAREQINEYLKKYTCFSDSI